MTGDRYVPSAATRLQRRRWRSEDDDTRKAQTMPRHQIDVPPITDERAARRFHQITVLERQLALTCGDIVQAEDHLKELKRTKDGLVDRLRRAARDEGELPLFDLDA